MFRVEWKFGWIENGGRREEIKNKENDDRNDGVCRRCNLETFEAGGSEIEKNEFGDLKSWNGEMDWH